MDPIVLKQRLLAFVRPFVDLIQAEQIADGIVSQTHDDDFSLEDLYALANKALIQHWQVQRSLLGAT
jgi:hypothetical protein